MRICIINNLYQPYTKGGTERVIELVINELIKSHQVILLTTQPEDIKNCQVDGNLTVCRYNPQNIYHLLSGFKKPKLIKLFGLFFDLFSYKVAKKIKWELKTFKPEIIITHNLRGFSYQIPKIIRKLKIPHIHVLHDYQLIDPHGSMFRQGRNLSQIGLFLRFYSNITKRLINSPNLVISPSKFILEKHIKYGFFPKSKRIVLPNPGLNQECPNLEERKQDSLTFNFLYLGQIEPHKGVVFLVRTFMKWQNDKSYLNIAGNGSQLPLIADLARGDKRIKIFGKVKREEISRLFKQNNVLIVPSIWWENLPTVIYEAYENQVPVLVSDSGGSKELVREGETGWIFKSNSERDLLLKLDYLQRIKNQLSFYGQNGYEFVKQFSVDRYVHWLLDLCQSLKK